MTNQNPMTLPVYSDQAISRMFCDYVDSTNCKERHTAAAVRDYDVFADYCMHNDLDVDTAMYDAVLLDLFNALSLEQRRELCRNYYPKFDDVMGVWLA